MTKEYEGINERAEDNEETKKKAAEMVERAEKEAEGQK